MTAAREIEHAPCAERDVAGQVDGVAVADGTEGVVGSSLAVAGIGRQPDRAAVDRQRRGLLVRPQQRFVDEEPAHVEHGARIDQDIARDVAGAAGRHARRRGGDVDRAAPRRERAIDGDAGSAQRDRSARLDGERCVGVFDDRLGGQPSRIWAAHRHRDVLEIGAVEQLAVEDVGRIIVA